MVGQGLYEEKMMPKKELLSVIVPVYNVEKYLDDCIRSIVNQTYTSLQIILIDDGSADGSGDLCEKLALQDGRIRVIMYGRVVFMTEAEYTRWESAMSIKK